MTTDLSLPIIRSCPKGAAEKARDEAAIRRWCDGIKDIKRGLDFEIGVREWCYLLEEYGLQKQDFDKAERRITEYRKAGYLPLNITIEDAARLPDGLEAINDDSPEEDAASWVETIAEAHEQYHPISLWENQKNYVELTVEKASLKSLFAQVTEPFHVASANWKGDTDIHSRANMLRRFAEWQAKDRHCVLLYCGDFDPKGMLISDTLRGNLCSLLPALALEEVYPDCSEARLTIDRFGLNKDFIETNGLTWVDGLSTGSPHTPNLEDPTHPHHNFPHVQAWLRDIGPRKVEASALVRQPTAARALCRAAILSYVNQGKVEDFLRDEAEQQDLVKDEIKRLLQEEWGE